MSGFLTLATVRPRLSHGRPPMPVVPAARVGRAPVPRPAEPVAPPPRVVTPARRVVAIPPPLIGEGETRPKMAECVAAVSRATGLTLGLIVSRRRTAPLVKARQSAAYIARRFTGRSLAEIGRRLGRDHATVLHACRKIEAIVDLLGMPVDDSPEGWATFLHGRDWPGARDHGLWKA